MLRKQFLFVLFISIILLVMSTSRPFSAATQGLTPPLPVVAIHVSELTEALETLPAGPNTPKPPIKPDASGYEWWHTAWHYKVMPESLQEALSADGTPYVVVTDADITAGALLHPDGSPKYPIVISLAAEAVRNDELDPLRAYVNAGGFLFVGSSSFTRNPDGTTRGDFALSNELGLHMRTNILDNWYENGVFTKAADNRMVTHIPSGTLNWRLPLTSEEIPLGTTAGHAVHQNHYAWAVNAIDAQVIANGSSGPLLATKGYGSGNFIYYGIMQPLIGLGGNDVGMYSYLIFRQAIEWAFKSANLPLVKLSPWRYAYDSAFIVRHDFENDASSIQAIESIAQSEQAKGVKGEYYFTTGVVRLGSEDPQLTETQKQATIQSLRRAVSLYGATIGSHNGGLPNPVNPTLSPSTYDYWHWGPDEALDTNPLGYASGKDYANDSINRSFQDIEGWLSGLDNGRQGCGSSNNCPRVWVSPYFNSGRDGSFDVLEQVGATTMGEQKLSPFPHWTLSTQTDGKRYAHLSLPVSDWYVGNEVAQSLEQHSDASMRAGVDFYYNLGLFVNFYGHGSISNYSSYVVTKPRMWSTNSVGIYDWWMLRSPVVVSPSYSQNGNIASVTATIANASDPDTAIEIVIPSWSTGTVGNLQVLLNNTPANPNDYRTTSNGVKVKVGNTVSTVAVSYELPPPNTPTPTPTSPSPGTIFMGETNILGTDDSGYANLLAAQQAVLPDSAVIQSLSIYISGTGGQLRLGIYDDAGGNPGTLRAQTTAFTPVIGWNTQNVLTPVLLPAGTYWLVFLPQSNDLQFRLDEFSGSARGTNYPFGTLPTTFTSTLGNGQFHWSLYATLLEDSSASPTPTNTPEPTVMLTNTPTPTPIPSGPLTIGETNILGADDSGNASLLIAQQVVLPQSATLQSLSMYIGGAAGQLRMGLYDDAGGNPGTLRAQTAAFTPTVGWNTRSVLTPTLLPAGTYWLAYLAQSNDLHFRVESTGSARGYNYSFGAMPATFSSSAMTGTIHWSLYATLVTDIPATPTPTNIPLPTNTQIPPTVTPTNTPVPTNTATNTAVPTNTPINTSVPTNTLTNTPVPTNTPTNTPIPTNTLVPTNTTTNTPIPTNTLVPTNTPTNTPIPTNTPTNTPVPTNTPTNTPTPTPIPSGPLTVGETNVLGIDDFGNGNLLVAQQVVLPQSATLQSLSMYITSAAGQLRLGLYDDAGGNPGSLRAQTTAFNPVVGWNTQNVSTPVLLPAGTYWLAYLPQSNNLHYRVGLTGSARGYSYSFGAMPATFSSSPLSAEVHWSLYATLVTDTGSISRLITQTQ